MTPFRSRSAAAARVRRSTTTLVTTGVAVLAGGLADVGRSQQPPEEIIVTSSSVEQPRRQIATAVSVIGSEDIELRGYNDLAGVLRTQIGIGVTNSGGPGKSTLVRIRGEESFRTLLMIDGVKAVDPSAPQAAPSFDSLLTTSDLQRVEVLRGPQGFIYGADAGGVVNVLTARGADGAGARIGIEYGELDTAQYDLNVSGGSERGDYFLSVTDLETDGFNAQESDAVLRDDDGAENTTVHAKLGWNVSDAVRLQLVARDIDAATLFDGCFDLATFMTVHDCVGTTDQRTYKLSAEQRAEKVTNRFGYSEFVFDRDNLTFGVSAFKTSGEVSRLEYTGSFEPSPRATLVYGFDLQQDRASDGTASRARDQDGYYFEYQGAFGDALFLTLGARHDDNEDFGSHTSTRLSGAYVHDLPGGSSVKYRASVGTGFRAPSLFEIGYNERPFGVHPDALAIPLEEEQSAGYDVGIEYVAANGVRFDVTYFDQEIENQISYVSQPLTFFDGYVQTAGTSQSRGIEIGVEAPLGSQWTLLANWTNNDADTSTGAARLRRPENLGNIGARYRSRGDAFAFIASYRLSSDIIDFGDVPVDGYAVLDVAVDYRLKETLDVYGRLQNALDEDYQEIFGFNTAGRAAYAGLRLKF